MFLRSIRHSVTDPDTNSRYVATITISTAMKKNISASTGDWLAAAR